MIRIFKLVLLLVVSQVAFGQAPTNYTNINGRYRWIAGMFDSTFHIPKGTTPNLRTGGSTNAGAVFYNTSDSSVYTYTGTQWIKLRGTIIDTTSLSNRINLKLNISDTASMLSPYLRKVDTTNKFVTQVYKKNGSDSVFYVRGGNHLWAFNDSSGAAGGGGGGKIYYFNGGVAMGTFGGLTMYELGDTANTGAAANFTRATTGNIANFITDPGKPGLLQIPAGVWSVDAWLSETGGGSNHAEIWVEVEKWDGSTITTIATSPIEQITEGSTPNLYSWSVTIPTTSLAITDRIIIQFYISNTNGKTVTLYTQNGYVGEVHTTFTTGIGAINGLTAPAQYLVTGTSGTDFNISSVTATHTFNLPTASATNRGALSTTDWSTFNNKIGASDTASMLSPYLRKVDTASLSNRINLKVNISDTASMLSPYLRSNVASATYVPQSRTITINGTAQDLSANRTFSVGTVTSVGLTAGTGISVSGSPVTGSGSMTVTNTAPDQTVVLNSGTGISISGTYPSFTITNSSPSSGGTVTSVGTNNGTGLTGGTITTAGTLAIDTALISTRLWRQKGIDSVQSNLTAGLALKVNISDTSSMLSPYLRKIDTTAMLSPYARKNFLNAGSGISYSSSTGTIANTAPDQTVALTGGTGISISGTYPNFTITNSSPSSGGTVTSVGSGTGLTGGPITTSGTLAVDTLLMSTRAWRQKGIDSVATLANTKVSSVSGTAPISSSGGTTPTISIPKATASVDGYLAYTDWNFFADKIGGSGTTNYIPMFTSSSAIGNSVMQESSSNIGVGGSPSGTYGKLSVFGGISIKDDNNAKLEIGRYSSGASNSYIKLGANSNSLRITDNADQYDILTLTNAGNLGLGVTPSAWFSVYRALQIGNYGAAISGQTNDQALTLWSNAYPDAMNVDTYTTTNPANKFRMSSGSFAWYQAASGTAGTPLNFTQAMTLDASGNLGIGLTSSFRGKIDVGGLAVVGNGTSGVSTEGIRFSRSGDDFRYQSIFTTSGGSAAANLMQFNLHNNSTATSQTTVMTLRGDGNVGIGTTSPTQKLDVVISSGPYNARFHNSSTSTSDYNVILVTQGASGSATGYFGTGGSAASNTSFANTFVIGTQSNSAFVFNTNDTERMRITSAGNVGIGTTSPGRNLTVATSGEAYVSVTGGASSDVGVLFGTSASDAKGRLIYNNADNMQFWTASTERMRITSGGNVGIGTQSPASLLHLFSSTAGVSQRIESTATNGEPSVNFYGKNSSGTVRSFAIKYDNSDIIRFGTSDAIPIRFETTDIERMRITSGGEVQLKPAANTAALSTSASYSLTGSNAQSLLDLAGTWNTTGNPTAIKLNITNTASGSTSNLLDLQVGGTSQYKVDKAGNSVQTGTIKTTAGNAWNLKQGGVAVGGADGLSVLVDIDGTQYYLLTGYPPEPEPEATSGPSIGYKAKFEQPTIKIKSDNQKIKDLENEIAQLKELIKSKIK